MLTSHSSTHQRQPSALTLCLFLYIILTSHRIIKQ